MFHLDVLLFTKLGFSCWHFSKRLFCLSCLFFKVHIVNRPVKPVIQYVSNETSYVAFFKFILVQAAEQNATVEVRCLHTA